MSDSGVSVDTSRPCSSISETSDQNTEMEEETSTNLKTTVVVGKKENIKTDTDSDGLFIAPSTFRQPMTPSNPYLSKSVMNLAGASRTYLSPSISRSESVCSIASSIGSTSTVTAMDIRSLTNNFQKLLKQATEEIKKLNIKKVKLEQEQEKLLTANVELAVETKHLLLAQKEWKKDKENLLQINEEFAAEVEKLYNAEDLILKEKEKLSNELKEVTDRLDHEKEEVRCEKEKQEAEILHLTKSLETVVLENEDLHRDRKLVEAKLEDMQESYKIELNEFETKFDNLKVELAQERNLKENCEMKIAKLSDELMKVKNQIKEIKVGEIKLLEKNEELSKKVDEQQMIIRNEIEQVKVENQWLTSSQKKSADRIHLKDVELESLKKELKELKQKMKNMMPANSEREKENYEVKNEKLVGSTTKFNSLLDDEVNDITEILNVIKTIQE